MTNDLGIETGADTSAGVTTTQHDTSPSTASSQDSNANSENNESSNTSSVDNGSSGPTASLRQRRQQRDRQQEREALLNHRHPSPYDAQEPRVQNGRTVGGTGRLPRDAAFTPTYINAFTFNSFIALISIIVTCVFFYYKIIAGLLESPQIGRSIGFGGKGPNSELLHPDDVLYYKQFEGEPRIEIDPSCPIDVESRRTDATVDDGCPHFGRIVILADSIARFGTSHATHGWIGSLVDEWAGRADVVIRTFPGYNTRWVNTLLPDLLRLDRIVPTAASSPITTPKPPPSLIIIALGTDDAALPFTRQHVSLDEFTAHLKSIIEKFQYPNSPNYSPHHRIVLVTPGPVHDEIWAKSLADVDQPLDRFNNATRDYVQAVKDVGHELRIPVVDLWNEIMCQISAGPVESEGVIAAVAAAAGRTDRHDQEQQVIARDVLGVEPCIVHESSRLDHYLMDGLHLQRMGNEVLSKSILNTIATHYPEMHPRCWKSIYPGYETLDPSIDQKDLRWHC